MRALSPLAMLLRRQEPRATQPVARDVAASLRSPLALLPRGQEPRAQNTAARGMASSLRSPLAVLLRRQEPRVTECAARDPGLLPAQEHKWAFRAALLATLALAATPLPAATIAITNAKLVAGDGSAPVDGATIIVRDGRVAAAGAGVAVPAGAEVMDAGGKWVTPGLVAAVSDLGINGVQGVDEEDDTGARNTPFNAAIDVAPAVNPSSVPVVNTRIFGVTRAIIAPSASNAMFAGQGAVIDLGADPDAVTRARAFQYVEFGENGARRAGGSRPAAFAAFRDALAQAKDYARNPNGFDGNSKDSLLTKADAAALQPVIAGTEPLLVHVERASDILAVLALRKEFPGLKLVLVGVSEGWLVAPQIAAAGVPVISGAQVDLPESFEQLAATQSNVGRMVKAGVKVAVSSIDASAPTNEARLPQLAGNLVAVGRMPGQTGLDWNQAFATISGRPAEAIGMGGQFGVLKAGAHGDVVVWDGDPLELSSAPIAVWIDGVPQSMVTRQTKLRDRYRTLQQGALPKAYER